MNIQGVFGFEYDLLPRTAVEILSVDEQITSDAGLLPIRELDERLGWTASFVAQLRDARTNPLHTVVEMLRQRVFGILADYEDQNDHDTLREDGLFKIVAGRRPDDDDLASQPTLSRLENAVTPSDLLRLKDWFIGAFIASFAEPPRDLTLDIDAFDDPTHGQQQLTFFHGYYSQYQYQPVVITCAENDQILLPVLLYGTAHAATATREDLRRVVMRLREAWPDVRIHVRADSGFGTPKVHQVCDESDVQFTVGLGMNSVLKRRTDETLATAVSAWEQTGEPQRRFAAFEYQAATWPAPRWVVVECEANAQGTNRRAVATNRPGARVMPQGAYEEYADRGESENRNKELKCELKADRLSDHRYMANLFRLMMHTLSCNLLARLRPLIAEPPPPLPSPDGVPPEARRRAREAALLQSPSPGRSARRRHACTWRTQLIKVAARIVVTSRRIRVLISTAWPFWSHLAKVTQAVQAFRHGPLPAR